jgi:hypothetical protein
MVMQQRLWIACVFFVLVSGCTRGHLTYIDNAGTEKTGCETEYAWAPSVDRHAVDYYLYHCARQAQEKGYQVLTEGILAQAPELPAHPQGKMWTWEGATQAWRDGMLTDKQYGYLVAAIDLNHTGSQTADN